LDFHTAKSYWLKQDKGYIWDQLSLRGVRVTDEMKQKHLDPVTGESKKGVPKTELVKMVTDHIEQGKWTTLPKV
jgi:hypothetical protein